GLRARILGAAPPRTDTADHLVDGWRTKPASRKSEEYPINDAGARSYSGLAPAPMHDYEPNLRLFEPRQGPVNEPCCPKRRKLVRFAVADVAAPQATGVQSRSRLSGIRVTPIRCQQEKVNKKIGERTKCSQESF